MNEIRVVRNSDIYDPPGKHSASSGEYLYEEPEEQKYCLRCGKKIRGGPDHCQECLINVT